jgi:hypothetical protein
MRWGQLVFSQLQEEKNSAVLVEDYDEAKRLKVTHSTLPQRPELKFLLKQRTEHNDPFGIVF